MFRFLLAFCAALFLMYGRYASAENPDGLTAVVISDLHFTGSKNVSSIIVSGMDYAGEITDAIISGVIGMHPDVFILTGDNTNTGDPNDAALLAGKLKRVKNAGIKVIITTGNHDFNHSGAEDFEKAYYDLPEMADRDKASLSYTTVIGNTVFLAMDDNAVHPGLNGEFFPETVAWLEEMLKKYEGYHIIFLSHHNVLVGKGSASSEAYRIQNDELPDLLEQYGVRLAMTGHLHAQILAEENGLYELVNTMPMAGEHTWGILRLSGNSADYHRERIDFETWGENDLAQRLREKDEANYLFWLNSMKTTLERFEKDPERAERLAGLAMDFLGWYSEGTIGSHMDELLEDETFAGLIEALWDTNYGPWMKSVADSRPQNAVELSFLFEEQP